MTDLIPRDAAIAAVYHADSFVLSLCGTSRIEERIELIPTIDPAAIREAALREAADECQRWQYSEFPTEEEATGAMVCRNLILDLIKGEKK